MPEFYAYREDPLWPQVQFRVKALPNTQVNDAYKFEANRQCVTCGMPLGRRDWMEGATQIGPYKHVAVDMPERCSVDLIREAAARLEEEAA